MTKSATWTVFGIMFAALAVYSGVLVAVEATTSQDFVRHYFSDIDGGRPLFAINTTLSMMLLVSAGALLAFAACAGLSGIPVRSRLLLWSQAGMLGFLAFDDRFQLHEALAYRLGIGDHFIMGAWAVIELAFILMLSRRDQITAASFVFVAVGGAFFMLMMVFDAVLPHDMFLRLSIEDLAKSWAAACFFAAAWCMARFHIGADPQAPTLGDWMARYRNAVPGIVASGIAAPEPSVRGDL